MEDRTYRSIWDEDGRVFCIDQTLLPFTVAVVELGTLDDAAHAIRTMKVRGAPLIGATAAYGIHLAVREGRDPEEAASALSSTRPTAVNLEYALRFMRGRLRGIADPGKVALAAAREFCRVEVERCRAIGIHGLPLIEEIWERKGRTVNILTHCNAGWLACISYGTATAPVYLAHEKGIPVHVWVSETRPRNQGARLTAWELGQQGVPYTLLADNAAAHLMQRGMCDIMITGCDRASRSGDVANKIGTLLKAIAAREHGIPFWVALPTSTIDTAIVDGVRDIPIEERGQEELTGAQGWDGERMRNVMIAPDSCSAFNPGFDVTPAKYVSGLITEAGLCNAEETSIMRILGHG